MVVAILKMKRIMKRVWETSILTRKSRQRKMIVRKRRNENSYNAITTSIELQKN